MEGVGIMFDANNVTLALSCVPLQRL